MPKLRQPKHELFAREVAAGAAIKDAYAAAGFKLHRANGNRLLRRHDVKSRIEELQRETGERAEITADRIVIEIARVAFGNLARFFEYSSRSDGHGSLTVRDITVLPDDITACLQELKIDADGAVQVKLAPKLPSLERLAEMVGVRAPGAGAIFNAPRPADEQIDLDVLKRGLANLIESMATGQIATGDGAKIAEALAVMGKAIEVEKLAAIEQKLRVLEAPK
jgi:phage terminase small subunit